MAALKKLFKLASESKGAYEFNKWKLIELICKMEDDEFQSLMNSVSELEYPEPDTEIIAVKKSEITGLLNEFWQRSSDACPLECSEHEEELNEWADWVGQKRFYI